MVFSLIPFANRAKIGRVWALHASELAVLIYIPLLQKIKWKILDGPARLLEHFKVDCGRYSAPKEY